MLILTLFAFVAGVATILTPCILPMVPLVLGTAAGGGKARPLGVVLGLAVSFTLFTLLIGAALEVVGLSTFQLRIVAVLALAIFGLALIVPAFGDRLQQLFGPLARLAGGKKVGSGFRSGLLLGAALGLIWAPCAGPILAAVVVAAATQGVSAETFVLTLAYSLGAGVPLLLIGYGGHALVARAKRMTASTPRIQQAFGGLMVATALLIAFNFDLQIQDAVLNALPTNWSANITSIELAQPVQQELQAFNGSAAPAQENTMTDKPTIAPASNAAAPTTTALPPTATTGTDPLADLGPQVALQDLGPAPEITGISEWINSDPLTIKALRGKVVLVHFWTFDCINCIHVQPYVKQWYDTYKDAGFVVLGVHTPELSFEKDINNVRANVKEKAITFPVAFDPNYKTWGAYKNGYWPAFYYVDKAGNIRYTHIGEGAYSEQEQVIRQLLRAPAN